MTYEDEKRLINAEKTICRKFLRTNFDRNWNGELWKTFYGAYTPLFPPYVVSNSVDEPFILVANDMKEAEEKVNIELKRQFGNDDERIKNAYRNCEFEQFNGKIIAYS